MPGRAGTSRTARLTAAAALAFLGVLPLTGCAGGSAGAEGTPTELAAATAEPPGTTTDTTSAAGTAADPAAGTGVVTTGGGGGSELPSGVVDLDAELARTQQVADSVVGHTEHDAQQLVKAAGLQWRVGQREGRTFSLTMDLRPDRITVVVDDGRVTKATAG